LSSLSVSHRLSVITVSLSVITVSLKPPVHCLPPVSLLEAQQLDVKDELGVWRDTAGHSLGPVAQLGRDGQLGPLALGHLADALVPAGDHLLFAEVKLERLPPVPRRVDLLPVGEGEDVVAGHLLAGLGEVGPVARLDRLDADTHGCAFVAGLFRSLSGKSGKRPG